MTVTELLNEIARAEWFSRLGEDVRGPGLIHIRNLEAWRSDDAVTDAVSDSIADAMAWLPSALDQEDPFNGSALTQELRRVGREAEARDATLSAHKAVLVSLRKAVLSPLLQVGPHDFTGAAKGAAAYAVRRAAMEAVLDREGKWTELVRLYENGHWPLGKLPNGDVVVL